jgi:hypothetical protein
MKKLLFCLMLAAGIAQADTVGQATSVEGHRIRLTDEKCTVVSGRSSQKGWGRTYSWVDSGTTATGCGMLDNDTVLIEWFIPPNIIDTRRYSVDSFTWKVGFGK